MSVKRKVEIFSAGCPACQEAISLVNRIACPSCEVIVLDMHDPGVAARAKSIGISRIPAVVIDGQLAQCCETEAVNEATLRAAGIGQN